MQKIFYNEYIKVIELLCTHLVALFLLNFPVTCLPFNTVEHGEILEYSKLDSKLDKEFWMIKCNELVSFLRASIPLYKSCGFYLSMKLLYCDWTAM